MWMSPIPGWLALENTPGQYEVAFNNCAEAAGAILNSAGILGAGLDATPNELICSLANAYNAQITLGKVKFVNNGAEPVFGN
jgi:hypothetical protein